MKFMTWNVNGIRTLTQYHPYCNELHKNYKEILDYLDADVICFQETKISRSKLDTDLALVPGYESFWSFHRTKSGYSGVAIYIKDHIKLLAAEEGISGILSGNIHLPNTPSTVAAIDSGLLKNEPRKGIVGGYPALEGDGTAALSRFQELDTEGRGLILDFGFFVLFNLYCPNETDETRLPFKMDYYHVLEARVMELIKAGREVMVMGDMNVIPTELDHCDPAKWKKESGEEDFTNTPPRRWFNSFLAPNGPLTDLYRVFHAGETGAFTCWNTKINARPSNYGTRLDYILVTSGLIPWFKSCDRQPSIVGSDHCPVVAEMFTELALEKSAEEIEHDQKQAAKVQKLQDVLDSYGGTTDHALAARFFDEFSGKQQKLSAFFKKPGQTSATSSTLPSISATAADAKRAAVAPFEGDNQGPRKKTFFTSENAMGDTLDAKSPQTPKGPSDSTIKTPSLMPSTQNPPFNSISKSVSKSATKGPLKKAAGTKPGSQQSVLSFFTSSSQKAKDPGLSSVDVSQATISELDAEMPSQDLATTVESSSVPADPPHQTLSSALPSSPSAADSTGAPSSSLPFSPHDFADWIPGSQDVLPFSMNGETTTSKWQSLFSPRAIPKCRYHNVPCTEYTVNKKGPNKGRRFFLCSMPVGPEGDSIGQNPEFRCNYFEWLNPERKR
ncbi:unnamed protein product [Mortierella alpina]